MTPAIHTIRLSLNKISFLGALLFASALGGCGGNNDHKASSELAKKTPTPGELAQKEVEGLSADEQLKRAFAAATGRQKTYQNTTAEGVRVVRPLMLIKTYFGPVLLTANHLVDGCHACAGGVSVVYLQYKKGGFSRQKVWKDIFMASYGVAPEVQISTNFTTYPSLVNKGGYTQMGYSQTYLQIVTLQPKGPISSDGVTTGCSNGGAYGEDDPKRASYDGKFVNVRKDVGFSVIFNNDKKLVQKYVMKEGAFKAAKPIIDLTICA